MTIKESHNIILQEEFYLEENVEKAIAIDEWSADALTTSMVDDVFFILQKCGGRALAIGSLQPLCAILGQLNNLLRDSLRSALEYKWKVKPTLMMQTRLFTNECLVLAHKVHLSIPVIVLIEHQLHGSSLSAFTAAGGGCQAGAGSGSCHRRGRREPALGRRGRVRCSFQ